MNLECGVRPTVPPISRHRYQIVLCKTDYAVSDLSVHDDALQICLWCLSTRHVLHHPDYLFLRLKLISSGIVGKIYNLIKLRNNKENSVNWAVYSILISRLLYDEWWNIIMNYFTKRYQEYVIEKLKKNVRIC